MVRNPERQLVDLPLLTPSEQDLLVRQWDCSPSESRQGDVDVDQLTETELDDLMEQLSAGARDQR
jgi:hypothetical protein